MTERHDASAQSEIDPKAAQHTNMTPSADHPTLEEELLIAPIVDAALHAVRKARHARAVEAARKDGVLNETAAARVRAQRSGECSACDGTRWMTLSSDPTAKVRCTWCRLLASEAKPDPDDRLMALSVLENCGGVITYAAEHVQELACMFAEARRQRTTPACRPEEAAPAGEYRESPVLMPGFQEVPGSRRAYEAFEGELDALRKVAEAAREAGKAYSFGEGNPVTLDRRMDDLDEALAALPLNEPAPMGTSWPTDAFSPNERAEQGIEDIQYDLMSEPEETKEKGHER